MGWPPSRLGRRSLGGRASWLRVLCAQLGRTARTVVLPALALGHDPRRGREQSRHTAEFRSAGAPPRSRSGAAKRLYLVAGILGVGRPPSRLDRWPLGACPPGLCIPCADLGPA